jgi:hypothetical protein
VQRASKPVRYVRGGDVHRAVQHAIAGRPVMTTDQACCITLYHAFSRTAQAETYTFLMRKLPSREIQVYILPREAIAGAN